MILVTVAKCKQTYAKPLPLWSRLCVFLLSYCSVAVVAEPNLHSNDILLQELRVQPMRDESGIAPSDAEGKWTLSGNTLQHYGKADGNVTQSLEALPNIHFDNARRDSDTLFNLAPPSISISGGRTYENNFTLDGFSINGRFDPGYNGSVAGDIPGHDQNMYVDMDMLDAVTVYQSNVPARFGHFLGGVVEMTTRSYSVQPETSIQWRYTDSSMVQTRIYQFDHEVDLTQKPEFTRERLSIRHSRPLTDYSGISFSFTRALSSRPMVTADVIEQATQESYNLLSKYQHEFASGVSADISLAFMPHTSRAYFPNYRYSGYDIDGGGLQLGAKLDWVNPRGEDVLLDIGYGWKTSRRSAPAHSFAWVATHSKPWGLVLGKNTSHEGGVGDLDKQDHRLSLRYLARGVFDFSSTMRASYEYGTDISSSLVGYERPNTTMNYQNALLTPGIQCLGREVDCIQGEQYFTTRNVYESDAVWVSLSEVGLFSELTVQWSRLKATLGARIDYNSYTENLDIAPRTRFSYDLFGDQQSLLVAGLNRYYGGALLTFKLREARKPYYREYRGAFQNIVNDWERTSRQESSVYRSNDLDTPYSDEITFGLRQTLLGGVLSVDLLQRHNRKQFSYEETGVQENGFRIRTVNNDGHGQYQSVSLGWSREWPRQWYSSAMITWSRSESTNEHYDEVSAEDGYRYVWYNNARWSKERLDVLRANYARPIIASVMLGKNFASRINVNITLRYESEYDYVTSTGNTVTLVSYDPQIPLETLPLYRDAHRQGVIMADASLRLTPWLQYPLTFMVDINNLGNARTHLVAEGARGVEVGRQFWLGLQYAF